MIITESQITRAILEAIYTSTQLDLFRDPEVKTHDTEKIRKKKKKREDDAISKQEREANNKRRAKQEADEKFYEKWAKRGVHEVPMFGNKEGEAK